MTDQMQVHNQDDTPPVPILWSEAPASWNVMYETPDGWVCQLTLRDDAGSSLLTKSFKALKFLADQGCIPHVRNGGGYAIAPTSIQKIEEDVPEDYCPIHKLTMHQHTKGNQTWYSHQLDDGSWCKGKRGK